MAEDNRYIEERDNSYYLRGHRIPLISIIHLWHEGQTAEGIQRSFSTLSLVEVYGAITYYLEHRDLLDPHFKAYREEEDRISAQIIASRTEKQKEMHRRFEALRQHKSQTAS